MVVDGRDDDGLRGDLGDVDNGFLHASGDSDLSDHLDVEALDGTCGVIERGGLALRFSGEIDLSEGRVVEGREACCIEYVLLHWIDDGISAAGFSLCSAR